ncbi:uroporphyrinogen-III C-methyltransferase [Rhodovulum sp. BSW8]|uniref:Uroporphyrin-III C-methyltransferase/precorrin-2 dehydrogenase/sirohydrochlorin ferrochelatase n=1 Tax=Rhodovulum visakhapatnamense TaxID=364297 RepID=A0A4R8FTW0_9RHOB|nr:MULTISPECIES: siroheme synthase CysG [Rhodovulum]RBO54481.1 uroporphyrinogen-III C-methyltransferase [Rhodovulum sp. BSW8]TDX30144.1 uroporphyrin-III C-methyltransferase/precorrin-2 dehydrogenase/sirohydrochlorin ferrochelatase [Rhodovulum visakhapatnamense]
MKFFPIFLRTEGARIVVSGGGETALAKLRLLLKTEARIAVHAAEADPKILDWQAEGRLSWVARPVEAADLDGARLVYAATDDAAEDARVAGLARAAGVLFNIVDNRADSAFITPALVDRAPVVVAIGTEGAAPVLARRIKAGLEAWLPAGLGARVREADAFRPAAEALPKGRARRRFWDDAFAGLLDGMPGPAPQLAPLLETHKAAATAAGEVLFVGAGPGDPDDLTLRARRALDRADVVIHDRLVPAPILELARREAEIVEAGKTGFGPSTPQADINGLIVDRAARGLVVVRLKAGDPSVFGRLDEEIEACEAAGIAWSVVPGLTAASAAAASLGQSLTRRGRNSELRVLTGHDVKGLADHDWAALARPGAVAAIYMGKRAARFIQGRLMMHGAEAATPVSVVENAGRPEERILSATLGSLPAEIAAAGLTGPAVILLGLAPRAAARSVPALREVAR